MVLQFSRSRTQSRLTWWRFGFLGFEDGIEVFIDVKELARRGLPTDPSVVRGLELGGFVFQLFLCRFG